MPDSPPKRPCAPSPGPGEGAAPRPFSLASDPRCELLRPIGAGAYGTVHLARLGAAFVAVKRCDRPADPAAAAAFLRELRGVRDYVRLPPHEGLVRVLRLVEDPGGAWFWYAMELADREDGSSADGLSAAGADAYRPRTLASVLDAEVALPLRDCIELGLRLSGALAFLQSRHLAHRDVKPSNVLFVRGRPVLADIGLVRDVREAASLVGTPGYAPPEAPGTPEGDVYGLGRTLWRAATGRGPGEAASAPCAEADVDAPLYWRFLSILQRACSEDPARRHRSAKALRRDLLRLRAAVRLASVPLWLRVAAAATALFAAGFATATLLRPAPPAPAPVAGTGAEEDAPHARADAVAELRLPESDAEQVEELLALERLPGEDWPLAAFRRMAPADRAEIEAFLRRLPAFFEPETLDAFRRGYRDLLAAVSARADAGIFGSGSAGGWAAKVAGALDAATTNALAAGDVEALLAAPPLARAGAGEPAWSGSDDDLWRDFRLHWTGEDSLWAVHRHRGDRPPDILSYGLVRTGGVWRVSPEGFGDWVPWADIVDQAPPDRQHRRNLRLWAEIFADFAAGARAEAEKPSTTAYADERRDKRAADFLAGALHGISVRLRQVPDEILLSGSYLLFEYNGYWNTERKKGDWKHSAYMEKRLEAQKPVRPQRMPNDRFVDPREHLVPRDRVLTDEELPGHSGRQDDGDTEDAPAEDPAAKLRSAAEARARERWKRENRSDVDLVFGDE